jgi:hypothetical protein
MSKANQPYPERRLSGLRTSTSARKRETVERLLEAIESIKSKKQAITAQAIYIECGLSYASYARNPEALALFRANSTHLNQKRKRTKRKRKTEDESILPRDPLMNYKKPQLISRLRDAMQQLQLQERQLATLSDACLQRDAHVAELEAKLAELEPYRSFVEHVRQRMRQEEHESER